MGEEGTYLLSWRWDCEESTQVWQNCADIELTKDTPPPTTTPKPSPVPAPSPKPPSPKPPPSPSPKPSYRCYPNPTCGGVEGNCPKSGCMECEDELTNWSCKTCCAGCEPVSKA